MRKLWPAVFVVWLTACDPAIQKFDASPAHLPCPGFVSLSWRGDPDGAHLQADHAVSPALPPTVTRQGSLAVSVKETTTFTFFYPSAAHREQTVQVASETCEVACGVRVLPFTGTCAPHGGPTYITLSLSASEAPGNLTGLQNTAAFAVHVQHAGADIALAAGGGPIGALPVLPAAGSYTITVPGPAAQNICQAGDPTGSPAPPVHLSVTPTCAK